MKSIYAKVFMPKKMGKIYEIPVAIFYVSENVGH